MGGVGYSPRKPCDNFEPLRVSSTPQSRQSKNKKAHRSARRALSAKKVVQLLERELGRQLNPARPTASQERVSYTHVASGHDGIARLAHFTVPAGLKSVESWIGNEGWQKRIGKVRMIQHIEKFGADLHLHSFRDRCVLIDRQVPLFECRSAEGVTAQIPEVPRAQCAIGSRSRRIQLRRRRDRARDRERAQIDVIRRIVRMIDDRSNHIGPVETVAAPAVVVLEVVVKLERLTALHCYRAIHSPAILELLQASA